MNPNSDIHTKQQPRWSVASIEPLAVDAEHAATLLGLSRSMFYKMLEAGRIGPRGVRLGKCVRFPVAELRAWAAAGMPRRDEWERSRTSHET